jgi:hypothetical protein
VSLIVQSYLAFDKLANAIKNSAQSDGYISVGEKEFWWMDGQFLLDSAKKKGLYVISHCGKNQSIMIGKRKDFDKFSTTLKKQ